MASSLHMATCLRPRCRLPRRDGRVSSPRPAPSLARFSPSSQSVCSKENYCYCYYYYYCYCYCCCYCYTNNKMCTFFFNTHSTIALRQPNPLTTHQHKRRNSARFRSPPNSRQSLPPTPRVLSPSSRSLLYGSSIGMGLFRPFLASIDKPSQSNSEKCKACLALHSRDELFKIQQERER